MSTSSLPPDDVPDSPSSSAGAEKAPAEDKAPPADDPAQPNASQTFPQSSPGGCAGGAHQWTPPPRRAASGFFDSIRRSGLVRTEQRWVGGVAGGVARRLGVDVTLVRCTWIVLSFFTGLGLALYGLGWALLPEESDGRIHVEQALAGDVSAGLAGAIAVFAGGLASADHNMTPLWPWIDWDFSSPVPGIFNAFWALFWICLIVGSIVWLARARRPRSAYGPQYGSQYGPQPHPGRPGPAHPGQQQAAWTEGAHAAQAAGGSPAGSAPESTAGSRPNQGWAAPSHPPTPSAQTAAQAAHTAPAGAPMGTGPMGPGLPPQPVYGPRPVPSRPRIPGPGRTVSLLVIGLALIGLALAGLGRTTGTISAFQAVFAASGGLVILLGGGIAISALRGRRGGWMTGTGWLALLAALPLVLLGSLMPPQVMGGPVSKHPVTIVLTDADLDPSTTTYPVAPDGTIDLGAYGAGMITLDLRQVTRDANSGETAAVHLSVGAGRILVRSGEGQPVHVDGRAGLGVLTTELTSTWDVDGAAAATSRWIDESRRPWVGRTYTVTGEEEQAPSRSWWHLSDERAGVTSPAARDGRGRIDVDAEIGTGAIEVEEPPSQTRWNGSTETATWVVDSWSDDSGSYDEDELPVTGMTHAAVGSDTAENCLEQVLENTDDDDTRATWYDLSGLSDSQRSAYEGCLTTAWERSGRAGGSAPAATPSAEPTSMPSPAPTR